MQFATIKDVFNDSFNLVLDCKDIEPKYRRTRTRGFLSTVRVISLTTCMLSMSFETIIHKIFRVAIFQENLF